VKKLLSLCLPMLLVACASMSPPLPADNLIAPGFRRPNAGALIVMLPAKVEAVDLQAGVGFLRDQLHQQLGAAGYKVVALDQDSYDTIWEQEVAEVGGIYDVTTGGLRRREYALALGRLVQRISIDTQAAMVLAPQLVLRKAEVSGVSAVWDGQQRRELSRGAADGEVRSHGSTLGVSVGLRMFASSGEFVLNTHGGASLPYRLNLQTNGNEVRPDLFANDKEIADGVGLALAPLLKK
jgi:hypothetical protein